MNKTKPFLLKLLFPFLLLFVSIGLTGCWSAHEVNDLAIVNVMGIDQTKTGQLKVTTVIVKPPELFSESPIGSGNPNRSPFLIQTITGKSMFDVMEKLSNALSGKIYLGHLNIVVFGKEAAKHKMGNSLDFLKREHDFRPNIKLLVSRTTAEEIVKQRPILNSTIGLEIQDLVKSSRFSTSSMVSDIMKFSEKLEGDIEDAYTGSVNTVSNNDDSHSNEQTLSTQGQVQPRNRIEEQSNENPKSDAHALRLQGTAVFNDGHLQGFLDQDETEGLLLLKGKLHSGSVILDCGPNDNGAVGLKMMHSQSSYSPHLSQGTPTMDVNINVKADIGDYTCAEKTINTGRMNELNHQFENVLEHQVNEVLAIAQKQWQTDIFGFGKTFYQKYPDEWKALAPHWKQGLLKQMDVHVDISANIERYGLSKEAVKANESR
ncbi:spore germination protein KC [Pullulanibacillus pueri]|uniref:Spore germination protein KC n=1 Tax=Pullulanibacillus pueri TaxID=1437324 RepID=A0A8J3A058_9BACL|nr:Ger(x)C family spore germination protein [Pullulanibacillus pueri]MBM7680557.1 spore germination protein KC [Pullulanibacillus pueri]GGH88421.1 hypothetical protein GCM10007096_40720 [Pullulanibacillus pueri]